jgi:stage III sporulation protein AF
MMNIFKNWIISIVTIIIFSSLADILLPKGNLKKLAKLVIGLVVIIIILNPILLLVNHQTDVSSSISNYMNSFNVKKDNYSTVTNSYSKGTLELYKENLINSIELEIQRDCNKKYKIVSLVINEQQSSSEFLFVNAITLSPIISTFQVKKVKKINIGSQQASESKEEFYDKAVAKVLEDKFEISSTVIKFVR